MEQHEGLQVYKGQAPYMFISYAHKDSNLVFPLLKALQDAGYRIWFDQGIEAGTEWSNNIAEHLKQCGAFLFFLSGNSARSENCLDEVSYAKSYNKPALMLYLEEDVVLPAGADMQTARFQRLYMTRQENTQAFLRNFSDSGIFDICRETAGGDTSVVLPSFAAAPAPATISPCESLLKRGLLELEDGNWEQADSYFDKALDIDPENAQAYLGKLQVELNVTTAEALQDLKQPFNDLKNYKMAIRFGNEAFRNTIFGYNAAIEKRIADDLAARESAKGRLAEIRQKLAPAQGMLSVCEKSVVALDASGRLLTSFNSVPPMQLNLQNIPPLSAVHLSDHNLVGQKFDGTIIVRQNTRESAHYYSQVNVAGWKNTKTISASHQFLFALSDDGVVMMAGNSRNSGITDWKDIVATSAASCYALGLKSDGTVVAVKSTNSLDKGRIRSQCSVGKWQDIVALSTSDDHSVGLKADGTVVAAGDKNKAQCATEEWRNIVLIAAGKYFTVGVQADGTVVATGAVGEQVKDWKDIVAISASKYVVGLKADGSLVSTDPSASVLASWKLFDSMATLQEERHAALELQKQKRTETVERLRKIREKLKVYNHLITGKIYAVSPDGSVLSAPPNETMAAWQDVVALSSGFNHAGITASGMVVIDCSNREGEGNVGAWKNIVSVAADLDFTVGLKSNGTVVATGKNNYGQCDVQSWHGISAIAICRNTTIGLKTDGTLVVAGTGAGIEHLLKSWTDIVAIDADSSNIIGLKADGTVVAISEKSTIAEGVTHWSDIVSVSASFYLFVGLKADGTVVVAGEPGKVPSQVSAWRDIVAISTHYDHILGLKSDGTLVSTNPSANISSWRLFKNIDNIEQEWAEARQQRQQQAQRRETGLCQHCGGKLKGLFSKKCTACGKPKDY